MDGEVKNATVGVLRHVVAGAIKRLANPLNGTAFAVVGAARFGW